jgi:uncharacterized membrane protein YhaH (DUF805 family)
MSLFDFLFGFQGRCKRWTYWLLSLASVFLMAAAIFVGFIAWRMLSQAPSSALGRGGLMMLVMLSAAAAVLAVVMSFATGVKRLHDRNKSGMWLILFYVAPSVLDIAGRFVENSPMLGALAGNVISLWALIELGFLRGTPGPNEYDMMPDDTAPDGAMTRGAPRPAQRLAPGTARSTFGLRGIQS